MRRWLWTLLLAMFWFLSAAAAGQALESVLMPGKLIKGHAKLEDDCGNCHVRTDRSAQNGLCADCHKPIGADVRTGKGFHGRVKNETCRSCHTDHKGRDVNIVRLDERNFDHAKTDFALAGAHVKVECRTCHVGGKWRGAPQTCNGCHRKDDVHKGSLGTECTDCHTQTTWKNAKFDHAKTRFPLTGKHAPVPCKDCHANNVYKPTPLACSGCHRKDDRHKGKLGEKCESCHTAVSWKDITFSHDRDTKFQLRGKHRPAKCESCHTAPPAREKTPTTCNGCHKSDDKHNGTLGTACADCHNERSWKETKIDHDATSFPLKGKHRDTDCKDCHKDPKSFKGVPLTCIGCHRKDDTHKGRYEEKCQSCHNEKSWKEIAFRHDRDTKYPLTGKHAAVKCDTCHTGNVYKDKLKTDCLACHVKDDKHKGELGKTCEQCHVTSDWKKTDFDHNKTKFPLLGRHGKVECKSCHTTPQYKDAKSECVACHRKDDVHKETLTADCALCHNARDWKVWDYDHNRKTKFVLDGGHKGLKCAACHKALVNGTAKVASTCVSCHQSDDVHEGRFGPVCERCHTTKNFRDIRPGVGAGRPNATLQ